MESSILHTTPIDVEYLGSPRIIAACLLECDSAAAIVDPGPSSSLPTLRRKLQVHGRSIADISAILLTHIHLDHAGATGTLTRENPGISVFVHERGARHLADPARLLESATRLYGSKMYDLWGEFLSVPSENIRILKGGEQILIGHRKFHVMYTPGHASHHVTYFDERAGIAFVGDTAGIRIASSNYVLPVTPPPDIDVDIWEKSLDSILSRNPPLLFLTHFGFADRVAEHLEELKRRLREWSCLVRESLRVGQDDDRRVSEFVAHVAQDLERHPLPGDLTAAYLRSGGVDLSWHGLAHYWRKRERVQ